MNFSLSNRIPQVLLLTAGLATPIMAQNLTQFANGQTADANAVNANFSSLKSAVDAANAAATSAQAIADTAQAAATTAQSAAANVQSSVSGLTSAFTVLPNGNVGIGVGANSPTQKLEIDGSLKLKGNNRLYFGEEDQNGDPIYLRRQGGAADENVLTIYLGDDGSSLDRFEIAAEGGPVRFRYLMSGTAFKPGGGSWSVLSDARKKRDIQPLDGALGRLLQLQGKTYYYKNPNETGAAPGLCTGFVAQDVEKVFPSWVSEVDDGMKAVSITGFEALTVESLRELKQCNDGLIAANDDLRSENDDLRERLASLEAAVAQLQPLLAARK
tara:strand:- start:34690 stop:35673 length:984 start_codon:yes stop_codon:yes gene_type:complete